MPHIFSRGSILGCRFRVWGPSLPKLSGVCAGIWAENHDGVVATLQANVGNSIDFVVSVSTEQRACVGDTSWWNKRGPRLVFCFFIHDKTAALIPGYVINTGLIQDDPGMDGMVHPTSIILVVWTFWLKKQVTQAVLMGKPMFSRFWKAFPVFPIGWWNKRGEQQLRTSASGDYCRMLQESA